MTDMHDVINSRLIRKQRYFLCLSFIADINHLTIFVDLSTQQIITTCLYVEKN
jgi:hypothetical protein